MQIIMLNSLINTLSLGRLNTFKIPFPQLITAIEISYILQQKRNLIEEFLFNSSPSTSDYRFSLLTTKTDLCFYQTDNFFISFLSYFYLTTSDKIWQLHLSITLVFVFSGCNLKNSPVLFNIYIIIDNNTFCV